MPFVLPELPFKKEELEPFISKETLEFHCGKHHQTYVNNLNNLVVDTKYAEMPIEDIITSADAGPLYNNAAQCYNHSFYWDCLRPVNEKKNNPSKRLVESLNKQFGSLYSFKDKFTDAAIKHFGSGWIWLVKDKNNLLSIKSMHDADTPIISGETPLLTLDVWEHAYYIDYRNARPEYVNAFWNIVNWGYVENQLAGKTISSIMPNSDI